MGKIITCGHDRFFVNNENAWMVKMTQESGLYVDVPCFRTYHFFYGHPDLVQGCSCRSELCPFKASWRLFRRSPNELLKLGAESGLLGAPVTSITKPPTRSDLEEFVTEVVKYKGGFLASYCSWGRTTEQHVVQRWTERIGFGEAMTIKC